MGRNYRKIRPGGDGHQARKLSRTNLRIERLENRRLLAGLNVAVYIDLNENGAYEPTVDQPAINRVVYIDLNANGSIDRGEPTEVADGTGHALFQGLEPGDYAVGLLSDEQLQRQVEPFAVSHPISSGIESNSRWLIEGYPSDSTAGERWSLTRDGILAPVVADDAPSAGLRNPASVDTLELGGEPTHVRPQSESEVWLVYRVAGESRIASFDLSTRELTQLPIVNRSNVVLRDITRGDGSIFALVDSNGSTDVVELNREGDTLVATPLFSRPLERLIALDGKFVGIRHEAENTILELFNPSGELQSTSVVNGVLADVTSDRPTDRLVVATDQSTYVVEVSDEASFQALATLDEAAAPLALRSNRLATADRNRPGSWMVWNTNNWLPIARDAVSDSELLDLALSTKTNQVVALTDNAIHSADFVASPLQAQLDDSEAMADLWLGVDVHDPSPAIVLDELVPRQVFNNTADEFDLNEILESDDSNKHWFFLDSGPSNGSVELDPNGHLIYTPDESYFGSDHATLRVTNGVAHAQFELFWEVDDVNLPPTGVVIDIPAFAEDLPAGSQLGYMTIVDPNPDSIYRVTTSDARFRVDQGRLMLDGSLDFESEPSVLLELVAVDEFDQFTLSTSVVLTVLNVIEPPRAISFTGNLVDERAVGNAIGSFTLEGPDPEGDYVFSVNDARFGIEGNALVLRHALDGRNEPEVTIRVTAADRRDLSIATSATFALSVQPAYNPLTEISLSSLELPKLTPGVVIGSLSAPGATQDDSIVYQVSDDRFEVVDNVLKLKDDAIIENAATANISVSVTATSLGGTSLTVAFPLILSAPRSLWQNLRRPTDVNGDGRVTPIDALLVINYINDNGPGAPPPNPGGSSGGEPNARPFYPDVNGDGRVSPQDALLVINELNSRNPGSGNGEGEGEDQSSGNTQWVVTTRTPQPQWTSDQSQRRRTNSQIDAELEILLDQIARDRRIT